MAYGCDIKTGTNSFNSAYRLSLMVSREGRKEGREREREEIGTGKEGGKGEEGGGGRGRE